MNCCAFSQKTIGAEEFMREKSVLWWLITPKKRLWRSPEADLSAKCRTTFFTDDMASLSARIFSEF